MNHGGNTGSVSLQINAVDLHKARLFDCLETGQPDIPGNPTSVKKIGRGDFHNLSLVVPFGSLGLNRNKPRQGRPFYARRVHG